MMAPKRLNILHTAFCTAKLKGLHNNITPAPKSFASELILLARNTKLERKYHGKKIKDSYLRTLIRILHIIYILPSKNGLLETQGKMASPLDFNPGYPNYWSADSRDALFGAHLDSPSLNSLVPHCAIPSTTTIPHILALGMLSTQPSSALGQLPLSCSYHLGMDP